MHKGVNQYSRLEVDKILNLRNENLKSHPFNINDGHSFFREWRGSDECAAHR